MTKHPLAFFYPLTLLLVLAAGCDSVQSFQAFATDAETQLPIDSVMVHELNENESIFRIAMGLLIISTLSPDGIRRIYG